MTDHPAALSPRTDAADQPHAPALLLCFALAILAMLPTQVFRLSQSDPLPWLMADYAGRFAAIGVLLALPAGRWCLRRPDRLRAGLLEVGLWCAAIVLLFRATPLDSILVQILPETVLGGYPRPEGWLYVLDLTLGLVLVSLHEELVFRKIGYHALKSVLHSEIMIILVSALIFGLYHWWRGAAGIIGAALYGLLAMPCYRRTGSLWPIVFAHFLVDYIAFV